AGTVPLLIDGDFVLPESVAILGYIADQYPHSKLFGDASTRSRAQVMRWLAFLNSDVNSAFKPIFCPEAYLHDRELSKPLVQAARNRVHDCLRIVDRQLVGRDWLTGMRSIADSYLFVILRWAVSTKLRLNDLPNVRGFARRLHRDA